MFILLPIILLLAAALAITIVERVKPRFGASWLIATAASVIAWLTVFIFRLRLPTTLNLFSWESADLNLLGQFSLLLDYDSWPYVLALVTVTLAVILTGAARTRYDSTPRSWAASLMITALGLVALQAGTSLMLMVSWVLVDLLELSYLLRLKETTPFIRRVVIAYGVRTASILMLFLATSLGWLVFPNFDLNQIPQNAAFFFLLAAGLRLGVFPLNLPFLQEPGLRRGVGNIIRLAPVASSLVLLARLPVNVLPPGLVGWSWFFIALLAVAALYASIRWLTSSDAITGRPFWIIGWASLATAAVLNGEAQASLAFGAALILPGSLLFLYFPRVQRMNFLLFFGLIGLLGIPFTPLASGWVGLIGNGFNLGSLLFLIAQILLVLGYLNRTLQPGGEAGALESWARIVYPLGLIFLIQANFALGIIGWPGSLTLGIWWMALVSNILLVAALFSIRRFGVTPPYLQLPASSRISTTLQWILPRVEPVFRLEWVYQIAFWFTTLLSKLLKAVSTILEGEGGILWTLLLLVLLLTLLIGGGAP